MNVTIYYIGSENKMVSVEESEKLGSIINELEIVNNTLYIKNPETYHKITKIIEQFDEVVC